MKKLEGMKVLELSPYPVNFPTAEQAIEAQEILALRAQGLETQKKESTVTCSTCQSKQRVIDSTHITNHWYESAHGVTDGDMHHVKAGWDKFICNGCGEHKRLPHDWNSGEKHKEKRGTGAYFKERKHMVESSGRLLDKAPY
ncbi:MAG TPA: hypothetical protein DCR37_09625 [Glaciecola sp.]|nr:hypothetical protein [Glaciecola sp.]